MHTTAVDLLEYGRDTRDPGSERHETFSANGRFTGVFLKYVTLHCILYDDKVFYKTFL